jgi:EmrB/QacA subfamily drug resistance transporter
MDASSGDRTGGKTGKTAGTSGEKAADTARTGAATRAGAGGGRAARSGAARTPAAPEALRAPVQKSRAARTPAAKAPAQKERAAKKPAPKGHAGKPPARKAHAAPKHAPQLSHPEIRTIMVGIMLAMFLGALDQTIVATALPTIGRHFNDLGDLSWVVTAYLVTGTAVTPLYGKLSDIYGRRVMMLIAVGVFVAGSIACALAPNMTALVIARAVQGLGGGGLMALAQTIIADIVTPRERGRYQGYIAAVFATSSVGGPVLGGLLTEYLDWSLIFWINLPLGLAALGLSSSVLRRVPYQPHKHSLDLTGAALMMSASVALLLALSWGGRRYEWLSPEIAALLLISAALWVLFAWWLARAPEPFLPLNVLGNPVVRTAALAGACAMGALVGLTIVMPLYFEVMKGLSAGESGVALIAQMVPTVTFSWLTGRSLVHQRQYKWMPLSGASAAVLALFALAIWPDTLPLYAVLALLAIIGGGLGTVFPISTVCMQNAVTQHQMGVATATANFFRRLFSALVVAMLGAIVLGGLGGVTGVAVENLVRTASTPELAHAFRFVFLACALVVGFGISFLLAMEERELRGPVTHSPAAGAPSGPGSPIPQ